jgi:hypothetical protein
MTLQKNNVDFPENDVDFLKKLKNDASLSKSPH